MTELKTETIVPWTPDYLRDQMGVPKPVTSDDLPHNWMYSFSPGRLQGSLWGNNNPPTEEHPVSQIGVWLVGFCKNCRNAFSAPIPIGINYQQVLINVPKTGCVPYEQN